MVPLIPALEADDAQMTESDLLYTVAYYLTGDPEHAVAVVTRALEPTAGTVAAVPLRQLLSLLPEAALPDDPLPAVDRLLLVLHDIAGLGYSELAGLLERPTAELAEWLFDARDRYHRFHGAPLGRAA